MLSLISLSSFAKTAGEICAYLVDKYSVLLFIIAWQQIFEHCFRPPLLYNFKIRLLPEYVVMK